MTDQSMGMTQKLAEFIVSTDASKIPHDVYDHAKVAFMDWMGVTIGGMKDPLVAKLIAYTETMGGKSQATVIGHRGKKSVSQAALINGAASHVLDYDDTLVSFFGHPSVTLFPSLLALSEWQDKSGHDFLTAYLIGLQAGATIGVCAGLDHYMAGWHATSTLGHLASAAGCARLLGLDVRQTAWAIGIAATQSSGLKRVFGTMCKPFHAGRSSQAGLMAALLAQNDFTSAEDILEGPQGFFTLFKGGVNPDVLAMMGLGWDVVNISQKYHASCHATHSPLEAALAIVKEKKIPLSDIQKITIFSSKLALDAAGKMTPSNGLEGKFSIPYCVANALCSGITGNLAFTDDKVKDPDVCVLMKKINVILDPEKAALESRVVIETGDGQKHEGFSDILQQIPPLEVKQDRVSKKYADLCAGILNEKKIKYTSAMIRDLDEFGSMKSFAEEF
ncbi:MAG: MmgE/PrpD family protein [Desulfobacteraceae bacterium]|nr:MmgE/PrpD family protein [Desulfobacteraceae bacterium]